MGLHGASTPSAADDGPAGDACHAGSAVRAGFDEPLSDGHIAQVIALPQSTIAAWRLQRQQGSDLQMKLSTLRAPGCRCSNADCGLVLHSVSLWHYSVAHICRDNFAWFRVGNHEYVSAIQGLNHEP